MLTVVELKIFTTYLLSNSVDQARLFFEFHFRPLMQFVMITVQHMYNYIFCLFLHNICKLFQSKGC
jgi:hypothetical protein